MGKDKSHKSKKEIKTIEIKPSKPNPKKVIKEKAKGSVVSSKEILANGSTKVNHLSGYRVTS